MTARRRVHIDLDLPELTPAQAHLLWNLLDELAMDLWEAYEPELLEFENRPALHDETDRQWTAADPPPVASDDTDTDF